MARLRSRSGPVVFVAGRRVTLSPQNIIGSGGEADVYDAGGIALKIFKPPEHADYAHSPDMRKGARERIDVHQTKLPALLQLRLPYRVVGPLDLARDAAKAIVGYTMPLIRGADPLMRFGERSFRQSGVPWERVREVLADLHGTVSELHDAGVIIGDFNDLNVLVAGEEARVIDADSFQFGPFVSQLYTPRFLDPLLTDGKVLVPVKPHTRDSDWYAYAAMAMQLLLYVGPYGGVHQPAHARNKVPHEDRPLQRITVFHSDVRYPKSGIPLAALPDDLLHYLQQTFEHDVRGVFPLALLRSLQWTTCACGSLHARSACPFCATAAPRVARPAQIARGRVTATRVFSTNGVIVAAAIDGDRPLWLAWEDGRFVREDGSVAFHGRLDATFTFAVHGAETIASSSGRAVRGSVSFEAAAVAANSAHVYWVNGDRLVRDGRAGVETIGTVLEGGTRFWVGPRFGVGLYGAGAMRVAFLFDAEARGLNDSVDLPRLQGQLVDADAVFGDDRCWLFLTTSEGGVLTNHCLLIHRHGRVEASASAAHGSDGWLGSIHGRAALGTFLFAATDEGIVRVDGVTVGATYPDTEPFVDAATRLLASPHGLYAVSEKSIHLLTVG